jgi:hypothetical protein
VHSLFHLTGSVFANAIGEFTTNGRAHDYVDASALADLGISGTGIDPFNAPYRNLGSDTYAFATQVMSNEGDIIALDIAPATIPVDEPFVSGIPFQISYTMTVEANAQLSNADLVHKQSGQAASSGKFADTLAWGGITSITDSNGVPLTGWTVTSASGFDYSKPATAPEPSTLALLMFAAAGWCRRRRRTI